MALSRLGHGSEGDAGCREPGFPGSCPIQVCRPAGRSEYAPADSISLSKVKARGRLQFSWPRNRVRMKPVGDVSGQASFSSFGTGESRRACVSEQPAGALNLTLVPIQESSRRQASTAAVPCCGSVTASEIRAEGLLGSAGLFMTTASMRSVRHQAGRFPRRLTAKEAAIVCDVAHGVGDRRRRGQPPQCRVDAKPFRTPRRAVGCGKDRSNGEIGHLIHVRQRMID